MPLKYSMIRKWVLGLSLLISAAEAAEPVAPLAKQREVTVGGQGYLLTSRLKSILVGQFTFGFDHIDGTRNMDSTLNRIGRAEGWKVDRISKGDDVTAAKLANYQVFFGNYISDWSSPSFPVAGRAALQDFVESKGNGLFVLHSSGDAHSTAWDWFRTSVHPCHYNGEAGRNPASTGKVGVFKGYQGNPSATGHPILEGIAWGGKDSTTWQSNELHTFDKNILDPSITPAHWQGLLSLNAATCATPNTCGNAGYNYSNGAGGNWPISWTFPLKKGNIGYFMEGHDLTTMTSMTQPLWDRFFVQFLYYIAGYDSVPIVVGIPSRRLGNPSGSESTVDPSGITFHPASQAGVLITKAGNHIVALYDVSGKRIREERGRVSPVDYDFSSDLAGKRGVYFLRVAVPGLTRTRKFVF